MRQFQPVGVARELNGRERQTLRRLIDAERRRRIRWEAEPRCARCGIEIVDRDDGGYRYAAGCPTCADRRAKHRQRSRSAMLNRATDGGQVKVVIGTTVRPQHDRRLRPLRVHGDHLQDTEAHRQRLRRRQSE